MLARSLLASALLTAAASAQTTLVTITLDNTSRISGTISQNAPFVGGTDDFSTALTGFAILEIDDAAGTLTLIDFMGTTTSPITLSYSGFLSSLNISASTLTASYAGTGPSTPVGYTGGAFTLVDIPALVDGTAAVTGSIFGVAAINESFNFADFGAVTVPTFAGTLTNTGGDNYALASSFQIQSSQPIVAAGLTVTVTVDITVALNGAGTGVSSGPTPCNAADFSAEFGTLDINDILTFANAFNATAPAADLFADGMFDINDVLVFANAFNAGCP